MKRALLAATLLAAYGVVAASEPASDTPVVLSEADMDDVTAAGFSQMAEISAAAEAVGRYTMTGTRTDSIVRGRLLQAVQFGHYYNLAIGTGGLATAFTTGEGDSSTSISTDDETANFTGGVTGSNINVTRTVLGLTMQRHAQMRFEGVTAYNHMTAWRER